MTTIHPGPRVVEAGYASEDGEVGIWKDLLVSNGTHQFLEIYTLRYDVGGLIQSTPARLYGNGPGAVLGVYDPDTGNGGGCSDGHWWIDRAGAHRIDFTPLLKAVSGQIPADATFFPNCWALHFDELELSSSVQQTTAQCRTCLFRRRRRAIHLEHTGQVC